ncbi:MAG: Sensor histidine kinase RcsC [Desulfovibrio sp.]
MLRKNKLGSVRLFVCMLVGVILAVFAGVFFTIFNTTMPGMLLQAEGSYLSRQLTLVDGLLASSRDSVALLAEDNAVWDETIRFTKGENPDFIAVNWADKPLLDSLSLSLADIRNSHGDALYSDFMREGKREPFPRELSQFLRKLALEVLAEYQKAPHAATGKDGIFGRSGVYLLDDTAYNIAIVPVVAARGAPEASGTFAMGMILDNAYFHKLTSYGLSTFSITEDGPTGQRSGVDVVNTDTIATYMRLTSMDGKPLRLTVTEPRNIYAQGRASLEKALALMGVALLLFGVLLYQAILRLVLHPVKEAEASLQKRLEQQELMTEMSRSFIASGNQRELINNALRMAGDFMGVSKILLAQLDEPSQTLQGRYEWYTEKEACYRPGETALPFRPGFPEYDGFITEKLPYVVHDDISGVEEFRYAYEHGILSLAGVPVHVFGKFWGMLSFNACSAPRHWTESDIQLVILIGRVIQGVVERSETEAQLVRMSSISDSSPQFISYMDDHGSFEYVNKGTVEALGYTPGEVLAGGLPMLFDTVTLHHVRDEIIPHILRAGQLSFELPMIRKDGAVRIFSFSAFTIVHRKTGIGAITLDVTDQRALEKEIISAKEVAERSNEAKSEFLSRMSHEMRTPLNAIIGMTNIGTAAADTEKKQYCLNKIAEASKHLLGVINDILDMSKIEANKFELSYTEFPFAAMIQRIGNVVAFPVDEKRQEYAVSVDPAIPYAIVSDEQRLAQVVANLLSNAVKFTPEGGSISLAASLVEQSPESCTIRVDVSDSGIGIPPEVQAKLFRSFEQGDGGISRKFGGTGLGLAISKRIVELLGGEIWVESEADRGSRFSFTFKAERGVLLVPGADEAQIASQPGETLSLTGRKILLAEDIEVNREIVITLLEDTGLTIECADNGEEACEKFRADPAGYSMIFMDIHMPEVDGYEATRRIRAMSDLPEAAVIPIIAMTANVFREDVEKCLAAGMNGHIGKPINLDELLDKLAEYCI